MYIYTSVILCIYMHRLKRSLIAKQSVCVVGPMSMLLSREVVIEVVIVVVIAAC